MPQPLPDRPSGRDASRDPADVARLLHAAMAYLATAFHLLQCEAASERRYEAQAHIYLAREEIEHALAWDDKADEGGAVTMPPIFRRRRGLDDATRSLPG